MVAEAAAAARLTRTDGIELIEGPFGPAVVSKMFGGSVLAVVAAQGAGTTTERDGGWLLMLEVGIIRSLLTVLFVAILLVAVMVG